MKPTQMEQNTKIAHYWACRYNWALDMRNDIDIEDLQQAAFLGILQARKNYDPKQATFVTWAGFYARKEIRSLLGITHGELPPIMESLDEPISEDSDETRLDLLQDETSHEVDAGLLDQERRQTVRDAVTRLQEDQRKVVSLRYFDEKTYKQTAEEMDITPERVNTIWNNAKTNLRRDRLLRSLIGRSTHYMLHIGIARFNTTMTSAVEEIVIARERLYNNAFRQLEKAKDY